VSTDELNFVLRARREKLARLEEQGIAPFGYGFDRTHTLTDALSAPVEGEEGIAEGEGHVLRVAGRLVAWRAHGKTTFAHLADQAGRLQLYFRKDALGDERYAALELLDIGDFVGISGRLFRTRSGELTIRVESFELLS
jgi:lysyl-tRNA synthetase class 2